MSFAQCGLPKAVDPGSRHALSDALGWIYLKKNSSPDGALQMFQNLNKGNPDNSNYLYHLGTTFVLTGDKQKARKELEAALAAKPDSADEPKIRGVAGSFVTVAILAVIVSTGTFRTDD